MASTVSSPLMKRLEAAEERIKPKDTGDLQRRIDDFATRYQEGETDDRLSKYPKELFEPTPEPLHKPADTDDLEHQTVKKQCEETEPLKRESSAFCTPLEESTYSEIKSGWVEKIETRPDGSTIRHVSIDLTKINPDEPDELDRPSWDWQPGPRPPTYRDIKRAMGLE